VAGVRTLLREPSLRLSASLPAPVPAHRPRWRAQGGRRLLQKRENAGARREVSGRLGKQSPLNSDAVREVVAVMKHC